MEYLLLITKIMADYTDNETTQNKHKMRSLLINGIRWLMYRTS